ncbi:hypothetical protein ANO11243_028910 [Dothideomycetidae sp. 11243]|nr:hypothetical protein ANO11243_028910 [fungal sp. No.11243]
MTYDNWNPTSFQNKIIQQKLSLPAPPPGAISHDLLRPAADLGWTPDTFRARLTKGGAGIPEIARNEEVIFACLPTAFPRYMTLSSIFSARRLAASEPIPGK